MNVYDCVIIGGGPAGLNAALVLGRARRSVVLFDDNRPRNRVTHASHGYLTRDGTAPGEFRRIAYDEVLRYPSVERRSASVTDARRLDGLFAVTAEGGETVRSRKLLIAAGLKEELPPIPGLQEVYGKSVFHCPYCDGWELRDRPLIVVGDDPRVFHLGKLLYQWSRDLVVCTNGQAVLTDEQKRKFASCGIVVTEQAIAAFHGSDGRLQQVEFADGSRIERTGGFVGPRWQPYVSFRDELGYLATESGGVRTDSLGKSSVPGLYAAGEAATGNPGQLIVAAASGFMAGAGINAELTEETFAS